MTKEQILELEKLKNRIKARKESADVVYEDFYESFLCDVIKRFIGTRYSIKLFTAEEFYPTKINFVEIKVDKYSYQDMLTLLQSKLMPESFTDGYLEEIIYRNEHDELQPDEDGYHFLKDGLDIDGIEAEIIEFITKL